MCKITDRGIGNVNLTRLPMVFDGKYVTSICLKCLAPHLNATRALHDDCGGVIVLVYKEFDPSTGLAYDLAQQKVQMTLNRLQTDAAYIEECRNKYKGILENPNEEDHCD
jgi:hypothetical protein